MCLITSGRNIPSCKDTVGGIKRVYLANFVSYYRHEFGFDGNVLTSRPTTFVYAFDLIGNNNSFNERFDGEKYEQTLTMEFQKQDSMTSKQMEAINYIEAFALIEDRNGNYFLYGLDNGLSGSSLEIVSGGQQSEFTGYKLRLTGTEKYSAPYVLDPFDNGFIIDDGENDYYQFQNLETFHFQDGTIYEFN